MNFSQNQNKVQGLVDTDCDVLTFRSLTTYIYVVPQR